MAQNSAVEYQKEVAVAKNAVAKFVEAKDTIACPFDYDEVVEDGKVKIVIKTGSKTKKMTLDKVSTEKQQQGSTRVYLVYAENKFGERKISKVIYR